MKYLAVGVLILGAELCTWFLGAVSLNLPFELRLAQSPSLQSIVVTLSGLYLVIHGLFSKSNKDAKRSSKTSSLNLAAAQAKLVELEREKHETVGHLKLEVSKLREALDDSQAKLAEFKASSSLSVRPEEVDAEVLHLLGLLQDKGRLVDFLMEDINRFDDARVGGVARVVHQGCRQVLTEYFQVEPLCPSSEGSELEVSVDEVGQKFKLLGQVPDVPPYRGKLLHRGWRTVRIGLPRVTSQSRVKEGIIAAAEIEVR